MKTGELYIGISSEKQIVEKAENGGVVTSLLKFALKSKLVDTVVAVKKGKNRYEGILSFITEPEEVKECTGSLHFATPGIAKNVKKYLDTYNKKIAVVCKSCDARALIELAKIGQVNIENIIMIGINCSSTLAPVPHINMLRESGIDPYRLIYEDIDGDKLILKFDGDTQKSFDINDLEEKGLGRRRNCQRCEYPIPRMADLACGKWGLNGQRGTFVELCSTKGKVLFEKAVSNGIIEIKTPSKEQIKRRKQEENKRNDSAKARQKADFARPEDKFYWLSQIQACIKCYGCRDVCPLCHCKRCVLERDIPETVEKGVIPPPPTFGMIRLFHVACYCVNCGQCEDVCSADIPISALAHYLSKHATELFDYESGVNMDVRLPLSAIPEAERANKSTELKAIKR
ncbi:MAG: Coenzyme F420 hydrogenase/dehydrogenase, beta subunit C-terminal domain [Sedimentisphaerales bacterium]|jgi:formate dehydrogenase subunit beta